MGAIATERSIKCVDLFGLIGVVGDTFFDSDFQTLYRIGAKQGVYPAGEVDLDTPDWTPATQAQQDKSNMMLANISDVMADVAKLTAAEILKEFRAAATPAFAPKMTDEEMDQIRSDMQMLEGEICIVSGMNGESLPGVWTRVDTQAYKDAMRVEECKAWTRGIESAISILKLNEHDTAAYQLAQATINDPRWMK